MRLFSSLHLLLYHKPRAKSNFGLLKIYKKRSNKLYKLLLALTLRAGHFCSKNCYNFAIK
nr:MAG TPA: hypothetical protein [Caudoviricetes sp.]